MTKLKDLKVIDKNEQDKQAELSNVVLDISNKFLRAVIYEIWVTGELQPNLRGFEFDDGNNHYEIILEIKKESLK